MFQKFGIIVLVLFNFLTSTLAADDIKLYIEKMINSSTKASEQPCKDFHAYACGNFNGKLFANSTRNYKNILDLSDLHYTTTIYNLLKNYERQEHQIAEHCQSFVEMVRKYFISCRTITERNLTKYLEEIKPGPTLNWPIFEVLANDSNRTSEWDHNKDFDLFSLAGKLDSYGLPDTIMRHIFNGYNAGVGNFTIEPILYYMALKSLPEKYDKFIEEFKAVHGKFVNILRYSQNKLLTFTFAELEQNYPYLNFKSYFKEALGKELPSNTIILVKHPAFFKYLNDNLWLTFEKQQLCNYLMLKYIFHIKSDVKPMTCVEELIDRFDLAVNFLYYHHIFAPQEKDVESDTKEIFESVVDMLKKFLKSNVLKLKNIEIEFLVEKLKNINLYVGNLPENSSCEKVKEFYMSVPPMDENNFYKNHLIMLRFFKRLDYINHQPYHNPDRIIKLENQNKKLILPFALLTPPIYDIVNNNLSKYSLLGMVIAQTLTQSFQLIRYNYNNSDEFLEPIKSYINCRYSVFGIEAINGDLTNYIATEVVRKIVTVKFFYFLTFEALPFWKKYFYMHIAQHFCVSLRYSLYGANLNWIAQNSEAFSQYFSCAEGDEMNPVEKCYKF